jgi:hypothetical protein
MQNSEGPMPLLPPIDLKLLALILGTAAALGGLVALWRWDRRRRARAARAAAVTRCGVEYLRDVLVPDGQGSALHVDFLLLTARGVVVIDLRDVAGNIFGGDQMSEWTVMQRARRFTFVNPQTGLYDRIAAVRALAPDLPVEGRIVFTARGRFPKGLPRHTLMLESLPAEFPNSAPESIRPLLDRWMPTWNVIGKSVAPSRLAAPKPAI